MSVEELSPSATHEERPRKRARSHSPVEHDNFQPVQRDSEYFLTDGSIYVLVQRVLFRVHRTTLSKDSSVFETMFTLPISRGFVAEGSLEDNPIILQGDTPEQFRSLLWALYAMPHEIEQAGHTNPDWSGFNRFCDLVQIAHKYGFKGLEIWALDKVTNWVRPGSSLRCLPECVTPNPPCSSCDPHSCKLDLECLYRVLELSILCDNSSLHAPAVDRLLEKLRKPHADLPWFIATAEHFGDNALVGNAYYTLMVQGRDKWVALTQEGRLSHQQLDRLYNGFYALANIWQKECVAPPISTGCSSHSCRMLLENHWGRLIRDYAITTKSPADVLGRLEIGMSRLEVHFCNSDVDERCVAKLFVILKKLREKVTDALGSYFVDVC